jgi:ATP-dependent Clp protease protease subunit
VINDERTEAILRKHFSLTEDTWAAHKVADFWLMASEAVECKLADEIAQFAPPIGAPLFNV